jgi:hypothetical protein
VRRRALSAQEKEERVRDDLVEGREALRLDDLERLETMAVQLDEAKAFLARGTASHARLAFILLDNAAEVIMRRNVEVQLTYNPFMEAVLMKWKEILKQHPDDAEARRNHDEVATKFVTRGARKDLARSFDAKVDFIKDHGDIQETESRVLKKLHSYRNELYHRDRIRPETVRSACLLYFDMTCALFERLAQYTITTESTHKQAPPALRKFNGAPDGATGYPTEGQIAASLRADLGIDDAGLKKILAAHLASRLDDIDEAISRAEQCLFGAIAEAAPSGPWRQATMHLAQWESKDLPATIDELLAARVRYSDADLTAWRQKVADLQEFRDRLELFAAFADIEDAFEPFEEQVTDLDVRIEHEVELELDMQRGK